MLVRRQLELLALALAAVAGGCYSPTIVDCGITCGADDSCPDGTRCGADHLCHVGALDSCNAGGADGAVNMPDARRNTDAPPPDAGICIGGTIGEPDNQCPGEQPGPVTEGTTLTISNRRIFPARDLDIYEVPVALLPVNHCPASGSLSYALRVTVMGATATDIVLRRFGNDRLCSGTGQAVGQTFCVPFTASCLGAPETPVFFFAVDGANDSFSSCTPYSVAVQACQAGSTCDNCRGPGPN